MQSAGSRRRHDLAKRQRGQRARDALSAGAEGAAVDDVEAVDYEDADSGASSGNDESHPSSQGAVRSIRTQTHLSSASHPAATSSSPAPGMEEEEEDAFATPRQLAFVASQRQQSSIDKMDPDPEPMAKIIPLDNVYSYFMFVGPLELYRHNKCSWNLILAGLMIMLNLSLQGIMLYAIWTQETMKDFIWEVSIVGDSSPLALGHHGSCRHDTKMSLCRKDPGGNASLFSCAPPTLQLSEHNLLNWDELDLDGDGVWTIAEVEASKETLRCKYGVNPVEVFHVFRKFAMLPSKHNPDWWIHPALENGTAIHRPYFLYAVGDIIMCGYRNEDMCPNLLRRGIFDTPLRDGSIPQIGTTIDSALDYCYDLLKPGGICERTLPSTYSTWRKSSEQQCQGASYETFEYTHPSNSSTKSLLAVDYFGRKETKKGGTMLFRWYKGVIVWLFVLCMYAEFKDIASTLTWVLNFPKAALFKQSIVSEGSPGQSTRYTILGVTTVHRSMVSVLTLARLAMLLVLTLVGLSFLLKETSYINLLLNGVGLVFVIEVASCLYALVLHPRLKESAENIEPMYVRMLGSRYLNERPALKDLLCLAILSFFLGALLLWHYRTILLPLYQALECTCVTDGATCFEAARFSPDFWTNYFSVDIPVVLKDLGRMREADVSSSAVASVAASSRSSSSSLLSFFPTIATERAGRAAVSSFGSAFGSTASAPTTSDALDDALRDSDEPLDAVVLQQRKVRFRPGRPYSGAAMSLMPGGGGGSSE